MAVLAPFEFIERVEPVSAQEGVSPAVTLKVVFRRDLDPSSIGASSLVLSNDAGHRVEGEVRYQSRVAHFSPYAPLEGGVRYRASVIGGPAGIRDIFGNTMGVDFIWNFTTSEQTVLPSPILRSPQHQAKTAVATPEFIWERVDGAVRYELEVSRTKDFHVMYYKATLDDDDQLERMVHVPGTPFQSTQDVASIFYWRVRAIDEAGTPGLWSETWQFNNATYVEPTAGMGSDFIEALTTSPSPRSYGISPEAIAVFFSEPVDGAKFEVVVEVEDVQ